jgi:hypothetical protein
MRTLVINSSNYVANSGNTYTYQLPSSWKVADGDQIGVASISIYNNTFNVTSSRGNNVLTIYWNANTQTTYTLTIPDGYYSAIDLNYQIQQFCILNNLYVTNSSGNYVYFIEIQQNSVRYALQLNTYYLPTSANATTLGYTKPSGATWSFPTSNSCPQIKISKGFGALLGLLENTYPLSASTATNQQFLSTTTPVISPIDSYILTCNLINSPYSIPSNVFFTIPLNGSLGTLITVNPSQIVFNNIAPNVYNTITVQLYDQLFNALTLNDKEMTLTLAILEAKEKS